MYPDLPHIGCSWRLNHHMGVTTPKNLYQILLAATTYAESTDPVGEINNYIIANDLLTSNIRTDTGQPDAWRDYQQILSELGLIFSTKTLRRITPTPLGLAFLDRSFGFSEVITMQAFRFQYPNGHHTPISSTLRQALVGTPTSEVTNFAVLQNISGICLRPAVLIWRVLHGLEVAGLEPEIDTDDVVCYLMRCATNSDAEQCLDALKKARQGKEFFAPLAGNVPRRNAQDWLKFLALTPVFDFGSTTATLRPSRFALDHRGEINALCRDLERSESFWQPGSLDQADKLGWYSYFGGVDLNVPPMPLSETDLAQDEIQETEEEPGERVVSHEPGTITLRDLDRKDPDMGWNPPRPGAAIESVYSAEITSRARRLHDQMVLLIAHVCQHKGATVYEDPKSVDLLVTFRKTDFIIEVKTVTPKNFVTRVRYAMGQVLHYDYLRSLQTLSPRRKVVALAAQLPQDSWAVPFFNTHMDTDLLSLQQGILRTDSDSALSTELFN